MSVGRLFGGVDAVQLYLGFAQCDRGAPQSGSAGQGTRTPRCHRGPSARACVCVYGLRSSTVVRADTILNVPGMIPPQHF